MGSLTKSWTEVDRYGAGVGTATWTVTLTQNDVVASGETFNLNPSAVCKYVGSNRVRGRASLNPIHIDRRPCVFWKGSGSASNIGTTPMTSGTNYTMTRSEYNGSYYTGWFFDESNSTSITADIPVILHSYSISSATAQQGDIYASDYYASPGPDTVLGNIAKVTLNAPPTFDSTDVILSTSPGYAGYTTASVTISNLSAKYGGNISSAVLKIGSHTSSSRTTDGVLTLDLTEAGMFTPQVIVTDSRRQVTIKELSAIIVKEYESASVILENINRTDLNGIAGDEGTSAVLTAKFNYLDDFTSLTQPIVLVKNIDGTALTSTPIITWYQNWNRNTGYSQLITDWSIIENNTSIYAFIDDEHEQSEAGIFDTQYSYKIEVTPKDEYSSGETKSVTLGSAFYTVDFLAGGHGIAFGQAASDEGFFCGMEAYFKDQRAQMRSLLDFFYPIGSYYETSDATFNPNDVWGGTWVLENPGLFHISGTNETTSYYKVQNANADGGRGSQDHGQTNTSLPYHNHDHNIKFTLMGDDGGGGATISTSKTLTGAMPIRCWGSSTAGSILSGTGSGILSKGAISGTANGTQSNSNIKGEQDIKIDATHSHAIPNHTHKGSMSGSVSYTENIDTSMTNLPPFVSIYRWHRIADPI